MSTPTATPVRRVRTSKAPQSTTGAVSKGSTVAEVICPSAPKRNVNTASVASHQTHGAVTPLTGAINNVSQLTNSGHNIAKGSAGSFATLGAYTSYLKTLDLHSLHKHAIEDARIVPIDDRERLIRRLETAWTATSARYPGRAVNAIPARVPFTQEQLEAQAEIKNRLLRT